MDYSRKGVVKKQREIKSTTKRLNTKVRVNLYRVALVCLVFVCVMGVVAINGAIKAIISKAPDIAQVNINPEGFTTHIYYSNGDLSQELIGAEANRVFVPISEIPINLQHAFVAIEDERFYEHDGIDIQGIFRAGFSVIKTRGLGFGGSTLTQQLLKVKLFNYGGEKNNIDKIVRKVQEQYLAIKLEDAFTKDEILEAYMNNIYLGNTAYGVQTAAQSYFGKDVQDLTLSEAAVIAPIALSPTYCNPISHQSKNAERRADCLDKMLELNFCTKAEYDEAMADNVYDRIQDYNQKKSADAYFSYFTDALIEQVLSDLETKKGYTSEEAHNLLYSGGLEIYSTQDKKIQNIMNKYFTDESNFPPVGEGSYYNLNYALSIDKENGDIVEYDTDDVIEYFKDFDDSEHLYYHKSKPYTGINVLGYSKEDMKAKIQQFREAMMSKTDSVHAETINIILQPQTSMTIMDQYTGQVVALYGGRGEKTGNRTTNRATNSHRSVGSTFKVLAAYLPALDTCGFTLASVMDDSEYCYPNSSDKVRNWNGVYEGLSSARKGIYHSMNIVACRFLEAVTPRVAFDYLKKLGFDLVEKQVGSDGRVYSDLTYSLALGGLTKGVTNMQLTAGYAAIANHGIYNAPVLYTVIKDKDGNVLLSNKPSSEQVFKSSTAWLLTSAMQDTVNIGTASGHIKWQDGYKMPVAGKTGTSTNDYDLWFAGFTPYYTAAIWTGFDYNFSQSNKKYQQDIWRKVMEDVHTSQDLEIIQFEKPDSITSAVICTKCGKLAIPGVCDHALGGNCTKTEYFAKGTVPTEYCSCHVKVSICKQSGHFATQYCPPDQCSDVVYLNKEETSQTADTPYLYPTDEHAQPCPIHSEGSIAPPVDEDGTIPIDDEYDDPPMPEDDEEFPEPPHEDTLQDPPSDTGNDDSTPPVVIVPPSQ